MDFTLANGKTIQINVDDISVEEWDKFTAVRGKIEDERTTVMKCTGLTMKDILAMNVRKEYIPLIKAIGLAMQEPFDPNFQSVSTSQE